MAIMHRFFDGFGCVCYVEVSPVQHWKYNYVWLYIAIAIYLDLDITF